MHGVIILACFLIYVSVTGCKQEESVQNPIVVEAENEIRLVSSKGVFPHLTMRAAILNRDTAYMTERSWGATASGGALYVFSLSGLQGVNMRNIQEEQYLSLDHETVTMARSGNALYVGGGDSISIYDISDAVNPVFQSELAYPAAFALKVYNKKLYAVSAQSITVFDIGDALSPVFINTINGVGFNVAQQGNYLYAGAGMSRVIRIYNTNNPNNATFVESFGVAGIPYQIEIFQNYLLLVSVNETSTGLRLYDLSDPANPVLSDMREYSRHNRTLAVHGQRIVFAGPDIIDVLQIDDSGNFVAVETLSGGSSTTVDGFPYTAAMDADRVLLPGEDYGLLHQF